MDLGGAADLAPLADAPIDRWAMPELQAAVATRLAAEIDLVDLMPADDVLRVQVVAHGRTRFERSANERARFEMQALSRYAHLNEERPSRTPFGGSASMDDVVHAKPEIPNAASGACARSTPAMRRCAPS